MHIQALGAVIDLRNSQVDEIDEYRRKVALHEVSVHATRRFDAFRCNLVVVQTFHVTLRVNGCHQDVILGIGHEHRKQLVGEVVGTRRERAGGRCQ